MYQDLCKKHKTFRERSENVDLAVEISLQPWEAFKPDGVILFSDILTPLPGMNIPFDIGSGNGPVIFDPIRTMDVSSSQNSSGHALSALSHVIQFMLLPSTAKNLVISCTAAGSRCMLANQCVAHDMQCIPPPVVCTSAPPAGLEPQACHPGYCICSQAMISALIIPLPPCPHSKWTR